MSAFILPGSYRRSPVSTRGRFARRGIPRREACAAIARLAALTGAGIATGDAIASAARGGDRVLACLHAAVRRGATLSTAMGDRRLPFDEAEIAVVRAGERGGSTPRALALLAERMERERGGRRRLASALAYPALLASGGVAALCFLAIAVLPSFTAMYAGHGAELPWATRSLLRFGELATSSGPGAAAAAVACGLLFAAARRRSPAFAHACDRFAVEAPAVSAVVAPREIHASCALVAMLLEAGCEAEEALSLAARAASNRVVAQRLAEALRSLRRGVALSRAWRAASLDRSGDAAALLEIAEATGGYARAFSRVAALEGAAAEHALSRTCRLAEPAAVVVMAVAVGGGVLALYQPMLGSASLLLGGTPS